MSWLNEVIQSHSELESPKNFWRWGGLSAISAVVKDNVWLNRGDAYNLYPNIYVIFYADSGLKKGPAIAFARDMVSRINNTRIISGRSSIQGILKKLSEAYSIPGGGVIKKSVGYINASELSSSIVEDNAALTILTDLYDRIYHTKDWDSLLKMESFKLNQPTVSLLGGINEAHAEMFFGKKDIQGGFLARTFVIHEKEEQTVNSLMRRLTSPPNREKLADYLREIDKLQGPFKDTFDENNNLTAVGRYYDEWYHDFKKQIKRMEVKDDTGTLNRFGDSVLKVAMLLSLAKEPKLEIDLASMEEAIQVSEKLIGNIRQTTMGRKGMSASAPLKGEIIRELMRRDPHQISRELLMKNMWMHYSDVTEMDGMINSLETAGLIRTVNMGNTIIYEMPEKKYQEIKAFLDGKMKADG